MNLHRHGYNGRGGEYYSEDPILSGYIGSASVQGAQSKGVLVNIKKIYEWAKSSWIRVKKLTTSIWR